MPPGAHLAVAVMDVGTTAAAVAVAAELRAREVAARRAGAAAVAAHAAAREAGAANALLAARPPAPLPHSSRPTRVLDACLAGTRVLPGRVVGCI